MKDVPQTALQEIVHAFWASLKLVPLKIPISSINEMIFQLEVFFALKYFQKINQQLAFNMLTQDRQGSCTFSLIYPVFLEKQTNKKTQLIIKYTFLINKKCQMHLLLLCSGIIFFLNTTLILNKIRAKSWCVRAVLPNEGTYRKMLFCGWPVVVPDTFSRKLRP